MAMPNTELEWWEARTKAKEKTRWRCADPTFYGRSLRGPTWVIASQPHKNNNSNLLWIAGAKERGPARHSAARVEKRAVGSWLRTRTRRRAAYREKNDTSKCPSSKKDGGSLINISKIKKS